VSRTRSFVNYWLPVLVWMAVIYTASADSNSVQHSRIIEPVLRWLFPGISAEALRRDVLIFRKCAHLTEYAILAVLLWRALRKPRNNDPRPWSWSTPGWCLVLIAAYAGSDEFHQIFVRGRQPAVHDVVIDVAGATLGLLALWAAGRRRGWWRTNPAN
jgi:VanZ family protein